MKKIDFTVLKTDCGICYIVEVYGQDCGISAFTFKDYSSAFEFFKHYLEKEMV